MSDSYQKKSDDTLQYNNQLESQVDIQIDIQVEIQVDTQIVKQSDKRDTIDDDNKRDTTQENARIIEMNVVKIFHHDVHINFITKRFSIDAKNRFQCRHQ